jgi:hypothetical protein
MFIRSWNYAANIRPFFCAPPNLNECLHLTTKLAASIRARGLISESGAHMPSCIKRSGSRSKDEKRRKLDPMRKCTVLLPSIKDGFKPALISERPTKKPTLTFGQTKWISEPPKMKEPSLCDAERTTDRRFYYLSNLSIYLSCLPCSLPACQPACFSCRGPRESCLIQD